MISEEGSGEIGHSGKNKRVKRVMCDREKNGRFATPSKYRGGKRRKGIGENFELKVVVSLKMG